MKVKVEWKPNTRPALDLKPGESGVIASDKPGAVSLRNGDKITRSDPTASNGGLDRFYNHRTAGLLDEGYVGNFMIEGPPRKTTTLDKVPVGEYAEVLSSPFYSPVNGKVLRVISHPAGFGSGQYAIPGDEVVHFSAPSVVTVRQLLPGDKIIVEV